MCICGEQSSLQCSACWYTSQRLLTLYQWLNCWLYFIWLLPCYHIRLILSSWFTSASPQISCNDFSSWNAYYFDLWPFCGANRVPDIIIPYSLIIFPAARQAARQHKSLFPALCWQVSAFPDYYRRYFGFS